MIKFLSICVLFIYSLSLAADNHWSLICLVSNSAYKFEIMDYKDWSAAWIISLDEKGKIANSMEAFFTLTEKTIELNYIEANNLREITIGLPSGSIMKPTLAKWLASKYPYSTDSIMTCYDTNGITKEIKQKIQSSDAFKNFLQQTKATMNLEQSSEFFYNLVMVDAQKENIRFIIEINWIMADKNCTARLSASSDFSDISLELTDDKMLICDEN